MRDYALCATSLLMATIAVCSLGIAHAQQPKPTKTETKTKTTYGNVTVEKFDRVKGNIDLSGLEITGKDTLITVPYPRTRATLKIHADKITTKKSKGDYFANTDLISHARFTIIQTLGSGKHRVLEGTSERATFRREDEQIKLSGNVVATIKDEEMFLEPAVITGEQLTVNMHTVPYLYKLTGGGDKNEIRFTARPKPSKNSDPNRQPPPPKSITIRGYSSASFRTNEEGIFEGEGTTIEMVEQGGRLNAILSAPYIRAELKKNEVGSINLAELRGGVHFNVRVSHASRKTAETLTGSAEKGNYSFDQNRLVVEGGLQASLVAPDSLLEPATIRVEKITFRTTTPTRYEIEADPKSSQLLFMPKPKETAKKPAVGKEASQESPALAFNVGRVSITQFRSGVFEEDKIADFKGNRLLFESIDRETGSIARFRARTIHAAFGSNNILSDAVAEGNVEYLFQQTPLPTKEKPKERPAPQSVSGNANKVSITHQEKTDTLEILGPFRTDIVLPDKLLEPGLITGAVGDKILITLVEGSYDFDITTPNQTAFMRLLPREVAEPEEKPKTDTPSPKGKSKS